ncbi:MAG: CPBP family intramembrane glutamic endopeptidase [Terracidiphilus sp.]
MDPETQQTPPALEPTQPGPLESTPESMSLGFPGEEPGQDTEKAYRGLKWIFVGPQGLRAGWSILIVVSLLILLGRTLSYVIAKLHLVTKGAAFGPRQAFFGELFQVFLLTLCVAIVAAIEHRHLLDYNLRGPRRIGHFISGLVVGFAALSALVGAMAWGGWLHFGPVALQGSQIFKYAAIWGATFLLVGLFEEGSMRCYLQYTLTRGINFWWAAGPIALMCGFLIFRIKGNGAWGVYIIALLGLFPCLWLHWSKSPQSGFWQAAWLTSTLFGFGHTGNNGENWIGIFAAAFIGFVFCVSVWLTGSAWWAIGCHAAWDWAETYFYGTADSGLVAPGHLLSTTTTGNPLWSGGADGPEGSLLIIPIVLLLLAWLLVIYRRPAPSQFSAPAVTEQLAS